MTPPYHRSCQSKVKSIKEFEKLTKNAFSQFKATIEEDESSDDKQSHFQFFQFLNMSLLLHPSSTLQVLTSTNRLLRDESEL